MTIAVVPTSSGPYILLSSSLLVPIVVVIWIPMLVASVVPIYVISIECFVANRHGWYDSLVLW